MKVYPENLVTDEVKEALKHVVSIHPSVCQVVYDIHCRWHYLDSEFESIPFDDRVDVDILEKASDSLSILPCAFSLSFE